MKSILIVFIGFLSFIFLFLLEEGFPVYAGETKGSQDFNFVVAGDFGCGDEAKKLWEPWWVRNQN